MDRYRSGSPQSLNYDFCADWRESVKVFRNRHAYPYAAVRYRLAQIFLIRFVFQTMNPECFIGR